MGRKPAVPSLAVSLLTTAGALIVSTAYTLGTGAFAVEMLRAVADRLELAWPLADVPDLALWAVAGIWTLIGVTLFMWLAFRSVLVTILVDRVFGRSRSIEESLEKWNARRQNG